MLTTNLSSRPFYNARAFRLGLLVCALLLLVLSALHLLWARSLAEQERTLSARATQAREQARDLLNEARQMRAQLDQKELEALSAAAMEVNGAIEQRAFSWSRLLAHLEATLPPDVRVTSVQPALEEEGVVVSLHVEAKSDEDLSAFMNALERKGLFSNVWPMERQFNDSELQAVIKGTFGADSKDGVEVQPVRTPVGRGRDRK